MASSSFSCIAHTHTFIQAGKYILIDMVVKFLKNM
jgi:hypothetical protein